MEHSNSIVFILYIKGLIALYPYPALVGWHKNIAKLCSSATTLVMFVGLVTYNYVTHENVSLYYLSPYVAYSLICLFCPVYDKTVQAISFLIFMLCNGYVFAAIEILNGEQHVLIEFTNYLTLVSINASLIKYFVFDKKPDITNKDSEMIKDGSTSEKRIPLKECFIDLLICQHAPMMICYLFNRCISLFFIAKLPSNSNTKVYFLAAADYVIMISMATYCVFLLSAFFIFAWWDHDAYEKLCHSEPTGIAKKLDAKMFKKSYVKKTANDIDGFEFVVLNGDNEVESYEPSSNNE